MTHTEYTHTVNFRIWASRELGIASFPWERIGACEGHCSCPRGLRFFCESPLPPQGSYLLDGQGSEKENVTSSSVKLTPHKGSPNPLSIAIDIFPTIITRRAGIHSYWKSNTKTIVTPAASLRLLTSRRPPGSGSEWFGLRRAAPGWVGLRRMSPVGLGIFERRTIALGMLWKRLRRALR